MWTWIFELPDHAEGCCDSVMIYRVVVIWIFGLLLHTEGCCDGVVIY
jgi:hypothetical protein